MLNKIKHEKNTDRKVAASALTNAGNHINGLSTIGRKNIRNFKNLPPIAFPAQTILTNQLLRSQSAEDSERLIPQLESIYLSSGEYLHQNGEFDGYIYFPETAVISHLQTLTDGKTVEVAMIGREGASGICETFGSNRPAHYAQVTISGNLVRLRTETFKQEFASSGSFQTHMLEYVNAYLIQISQRVVCESFHVIEERLASWLLMIQNRVKKNQWEITHEQISLILGVNRPTVTQAAKALRDKNLIDYSRGRLKIINRLELELSACECFSTLQNIH